MSATQYLLHGRWDKYSNESTNFTTTRRITEFKKLTLMNLKVKDDSLEPLIQLKNLRELSLSNQFKVEEYAKLSVALPYTKCEFFRPYVYMNDAIEGKNIMVIGRRRPILNSKTDMVKMQKYEEQFKSYKKNIKH